MNKRLLFVSSALFYFVDLVSGRINHLDTGLQWQYVSLELDSGAFFTGQVVGVYNDAHFMWQPADKSTLTIFTCSHLGASLSDFSLVGGQDPAIFIVTSDELSTITILDNPDGLVDYELFMVQNGHVFGVSPVDGEIYIGRAWDSYHLDEDGRGTYAWDIMALNDNMMTYTGYGTSAFQFEVWGRTVRLPMSGKVVTAVNKMVDNAPDLTAAVDLEDAEPGEEQLEEKPHNIIELQVGGDNSPFLLRIIHLKQNTIPAFIVEGITYPEGTVVGEVGNSGTTLVPHLHIVWGFTDINGRYWALPIHWANIQKRRLLAYPTGYQYSTARQRGIYYPKHGDLLSNF